MELCDSDQEGGGVGIMQQPTFHNPLSTDGVLERIGMHDDCRVLRAEE